MVCATTDQGTQRWTCNYSVTGATGTAIGTGVTNTPLITSTAGCTYAAQTCRNLNLNGYTDWFLPSINELNQLYVNKNAVNQTLGAIGGNTILAYYYYWSSSEINSFSARVVHFGIGTSSAYGKTVTSIKVRAVRAF